MNRLLSILLDPSLINYGLSLFELIADALKPILIDLIDLIFVMTLLLLILTSTKMETSLEFIGGLRVSLIFGASVVLIRVRAIECSMPQRDLIVSGSHDVCSQSALSHSVHIDLGNGLCLVWGVIRESIIIHVLAIVIGFRGRLGSLPDISDFLLEVLLQSWLRFNTLSLVEDMEFFCPNLSEFLYHPLQVAGKLIR